MEIGEHHSEVELSMDRFIEEGHNMLIIMEMILEKEILEEHQIVPVKVLEVYIEVIIEWQFWKR